MSVSGRVIFGNLGILPDPFGSIGNPFLHDVGPLRAALPKKPRTTRLKNTGPQLMLI